MKKYVPLALVSFVGMVAVLWSITWFVQARRIEAWAQNEMKNLNPALGAIQAASVKTSGFPAKMVVTFTNPTVTVHMKQALTLLDKYRAARAGNSAAVLTTPEYPESTLQYSLQGTLTIALNALADIMDVTYDGSATTQLAQAQDAISLAVDYNGPTHCRARMQRGMASLFKQAWDMSAYFEPAEFAAKMKEISCDFAGNVTTNSISNQMVSSMGPLSFSITNQLAGDMAQIAARVNFSDYEVLPAGDDVINRFRRAVTPANQTFVPAVMSLYGKQSFGAELAMEMPQDSKMAAEKPVSVNLKQFTLANDASNTKGSFKFTSQPTPADVSGEFALDLSTEFTGKQAEISRMNVARYAQELLGMQDAARAAATTGDPAKIAAAPPLLDPALANDPKRLENTLYSALPDVSKLGALRQNVSFAYQLKKGVREGNVTVSNLEISTRDYALSGTGQGSMNAGQMLPTIAANLTCRNCSAMLDAIEAYLARAQSAIFIISGNPHILPAPEMVHGVTQLLEAVGTKPATSPLDLQFSISSNNGALDINGKSLNELMAMAQQYLPQPKPAAPAP